MGKVFDLNGKDLTKTDATLRVPEAPADAAEVGKRNDAQTESLKAEKSRAEGAEQKLQQQVDTLNAGGLNLKEDLIRTQVAEQKLQQQVDTLNAGGLNLKEDLIRTQVDSYLTQHPEAMGTALAEEVTRAKAAEEENAKGVSQLKEDIEDIGIYKKEDLPAYMGGIAADKGYYAAAIEYLDMKNRLRTINRITSAKEAFLLKAGKKYLVTVKDGYVYALQLFDSIGGVALLDFKYRSDDYKIEYDRDVYAEFMIKKIDE